jgi:hypothetical protein
MGCGGRHTVKQSAMLWLEPTHDELRELIPVLLPGGRPSDDVEGKREATGAAALS